MATIQTDPLAPGLYEAAVTFEADLFPGYPINPYDMPAWLSINATRVAGGQPPVHRPASARHPRGCIGSPCVAAGRPSPKCH